MNIEIVAGSDNGVEVLVGDALAPFIPRSTIGDTEVATASLGTSDTDATWATSAAGYSADNGTTGDGAPNKLHLPFEWLHSQSGLVLIAEQDGAVYGRLRLSEGEYATGINMQLGSADEWLTVAYRRNPSGIDGEGDWLECKPGTGVTLSEPVVVRVYPSIGSPSVGVTDDDLNRLRASVNAKDAVQDAEIAALQAGAGNPGMPSLTEARVNALIQAALAAFMPRRITDVAQIHSDVANRQFTVDQYDGTGALTHLVIGYGGTGASGLTETAAVNAALAYLASQLSEFTWDAATRTLTYTPDPVADDSVTFAKLDEATRNLINAKANTDQLRPEARADNRVLTDEQKTDARAFIDAAKAGEEIEGLDRLLTAPAIAGYDKGDIVDVNGDLLVLINDAADSNVLRGTAGSFAGANYIGVRQGITAQAKVGSVADPALVVSLGWLGSGGADPAWRLDVSKAAGGVTPPASLWVRTVGESGVDASGNSIRHATSEAKLDRTPANDTASAWAYRSGATGVDSPIVAGDTFDARFFTDGGFSTPFVIHTVDRWERWLDIQKAGITHIPDGSLGTAAYGDKSITGAKVADATLDARTLAPGSVTPDKFEAASVTEPAIADDVLIPRMFASESVDSDAIALLNVLEGHLADDGVSWAKLAIAVRNAINHDIPTGTTLPQRPSEGDRFILLREDTVPNDRAVQSVQRQPTLRQVYFGGGVAHPRYLRAYAPNYSGSNAVALRGKVFLVYGGTRTTIASKLVWHRAQLARTEYNVSSTAVPGLPYWYAVAGLTWDSLAPGTYYANVINDDGAKMFADTQLPIADYTYDGTEWIHTPGVAAWWAVQGRPEPRTLAAVTTLHSGPGSGLTVANSGQDARAGATAFQVNGANFDLDDVDKMHGLISVEATLALARRTSNTIGFDDNTSDPQLQADISGFTTASRVRSLAAYTGSTATKDNGREIGRVTVRNGAGTLGVGRLMIGHGGQNVLAYWIEWLQNSGALGFDIVVQDLVAVFVHQDGADAPSKFRELDDVESSYVDKGGFNVRINAAENGAVFEERDSVGRMVAKVSNLPTAAVAKGVQLVPHPGTVGANYATDWVQIAGYAKVGSPASSNLSLPILLFPPLRRPKANVCGLYARSLVGTVVKDEIGPIPWGPPVVFTSATEHKAISAPLLFRGGGLNDGGALAQVRVVFNRAGGETVPQIELHGAGTVLPANCSIEIFEAVV